MLAQYDGGASAPLSFYYWNELDSRSLSDIERSIGMDVFQRKLAASAGDKWQLMSIPNAETSTSDGPDKLSVDDALGAAGEAQRSSASCSSISLKIPQKKSQTQPA